MCVHGGARREGEGGRKDEEGVWDWRSRREERVYRETRSKGVHLLGWGPPFPGCGAGPCLLLAPLGDPRSSQGQREKRSEHEERHGIDFVFNLL